MTKKASDYELSLHAESRMQQRGIPPLAVELIVRHGRHRWTRGGARSFYFTKDKLSRARDHLPDPAYRSVEKALKSGYVIVSSEGTVITTGWQTSRLRK